MSNEKINGKAVVTLNSNEWFYGGDSTGSYNAAYGDVEMLEHGVLVKGENEQVFFPHKAVLSIFTDSPCPDMRAIRRME